MRVTTFACSYIFRQLCTYQSISSPIPHPGKGVALEWDFIKINAPDDGAALSIDSQLLRLVKGYPIWSQCIKFNASHQGCTHNHSQSNPGPYTGGGGGGGFDRTPLSPQTHALNKITITSLGLIDTIIV